MTEQEFFTDGTNWVLLKSSGMPPNSINGLVLVVPPQGIVTKLTFRYKQAEIAKWFGVTQQSVSRWVSSYSTMRLSDDGWSTVAKLTVESQSIDKTERNSDALNRRRKTPVVVLSDEAMS